MFEYACDLLAVSVQNEKFSVPSSSDECYKLFRTYRVINWCQFDESVDPGTPLFDRFDSYFDLEPLVVSRDEDGDGKPGDEDVYVRFKGWETDKDHLNEIQRIYDEYGLTIDYTADSEEGTHGITYIDDNCDPFDYEHYDPTEGYWRYAHYARGFYQYTQVLKVFDAVPPVVTITGDDKFPSYASPGKDDKNDTFKNGLPEVCVGDMTLDIEITEICTPDYVDLKKILLLPDSDLGVGSIYIYGEGATTEDGEAFNFEVSGSGNQFTLSGTFPIGTHELEIHGQDGCGNADADFVTFTIYDAKAPAPICISSLSTELMPDGEGGGAMAVWANDFIASDIWDCSEPIKYYIKRSEEVDAALAAGEEIEFTEDDKAVTVTCADPELVIVYIFAVDAAGNYDRCEASLAISDFMNLCGAGPVGASLVGLIADEESNPTVNAEVSVSGMHTGTMTTTANGTYAFNNIAEGSDITVTPYKDIDHAENVSTFDLIIIARHILGVEPLDSPYKMIAADVNSSRSITTLDLIQLRKFILRIDVEFANNTSWRFVDKSYVFPDPTNPWAETFPEIINYNNLDRNVLDADFVAVKIGDVNPPKGSGIDGNSIAGVFHLDMEDQTLVAGNEYRIAVTSAQLAEIRGYQFTLNYTTDVEVTDVEEGIAKTENFGFAQMANRAITTSWDGETSTGDLFTLVLYANNDAQLSEVLNISSRYTQAEAYSTTDEQMEVAINFGGTVAEAGFKLYQNTPNPFQGETRIGFDMPQAEEGTLTVFDINGKALKVVRRTFDKGYNEVRFKSNQLPAGVLSYTVTAGEYSATKKMINID